MPGSTDGVNSSFFVKILTNTQFHLFINNGNENNMNIEKCIRRVRILCKSIKQLYAGYCGRNIRTNDIAHLESEIYLDRRSQNSDKFGGSRKSTVVC